jgi:hypothetical protein
MSDFQITGILLSVTAVEVEHSGDDKHKTGRECHSVTPKGGGRFPQLLFVPRIGEHANIHSSVTGLVTDIETSIYTIPMQGIELTVEVQAGDVDKLVAGGWKRTSKKHPVKKT